MKKILSKILLISFLLILGCNKNIDEPSLTDDSKNSTFSINTGCIDCGDDLGTHHNRIMDILFANLPVFDSNATKFDLINYVQNTIHGYLLDSLNYDQSTIDSVEELMISSNILNTAYPDDPNGYPLNVNWFSFSEQALDYLKYLNDTLNSIYLITDREYYFITNAFQDIYENSSYETLDYLTTSSMMLAKINNYIQQWNNIQWSQDEGISSCLFLSQSKASTIYSRDFDYGIDTTNIPNGPELVAQVAADAGGAIVGGALGAASSYIGSGKITWGVVGAGAFVGAVNTTFPGLGGKVGSTLLGWASKLIKK